MMGILHDKRGTEVFLFLGHMIKAAVSYQFNLGTIAEGCPLLLYSMRGKWEERTWLER